ncbi:MAG: outer membrane beta-barrel family protein, partial [Duncaniella sp.]|nr:outer membrane beta-barrel family protein [Duncaniella sp.]
LDYRMETPEVAGYIPSTSTEATQTSAALFASWSRSFGPMSLTAGLRYEYVDYLFCRDGAKDTDMSRRDNLLTPDLSLGWNFKDGSQLSLSYRMVTQRPPYSQLTRSLGYVGSHEIEGGNPALRDEHMHDIQLFGLWKDFILQADFTRSLDTYGFVKRIYPASDLQLIMQPINLNVSSLDCYLVWERAIRSWRPQVTLGMHRQWLGIEGRRYDKPIFTYFFDNTITLPLGWMLTIGAWGQTEGDMHTNRFGTTWFSMDASVSRSFFNKALQVNLSATDIFNTASNDWTMDTYGVKVDKRQRYDRRGVSLSITYRFQPNRYRYRGKSASEAEMKRL